ncbi:MAG: 3-oxoacyl-[acyl-carrier-protein] reductase [Phycisphaerales bacterium]|nr:3-oxoacyl-[acyl-carrier-protein] reductase [Phycisphaerales bacterium]
MTTDKRIAVVTGASRGIGRAISLRLAKDGRHVVLVARTESALNDVKHSIEANGGSASVVAADISSASAFASAIEKIAADHGRLDILVNNAGITKDGLALRMSDDDWNSVISTNLTSAFVAIRAAARAMMKGKFGRIVNIASTSGVVGNAGQANYAAAKAGLIGLSKTIARELGGKNITCNVVAPGYIETDMTNDLPQQVKDHVMGLIAVKRFGIADDIAAAVSYATSDEAGFFTGQTLIVDGGMTMA